MKFDALDNMTNESMDQPRYFIVRQVNDGWVVPERLKDKKFAFMCNTDATFPFRHEGVDYKWWTIVDGSEVGQDVAEILLEPVKA